MLDFHWLFLLRGSNACRLSSLLLAVVVQWLNCVWLCATLWTAAGQAPMSFTISWVLLRFMAIGLMMLSNHLILCRSPSLLLCIFPSNRVFSSELALRTRWPKYWSFSCSISPSSEYSGLISFIMDWLDILAIQGDVNVKKASVLLYSAFFIVQLSHPYATTGKTTALTIWTFVGKVMSLLF